MTPAHAKTNWTQIVAAAVLRGIVSSFATGAAGYITFNGRLQAVEERTASNADTKEKLQSLAIAQARVEAKLDSIIEDRRRNDRVSGSSFYGGSGSMAMQQSE